MDRPKKIIQVLRQFEEVFSEHVWEWAKVLVIGAILAKGRTNGDSDLTSHGAEPETAVSERSPSPQSSEVVGESTQPHSFAFACTDFCAR